MLSCIFQNTRLQYVFKLLIYFLVGLLALTVGPGDNAREILEESVTPLSQAFKSGSEPSKTASVSEKFNRIHPTSNILWLL